MVIWSRIATIVFGALPATWLCFWAACGMALGAAAMLVDAIGGIFLIIWGLAVMYGTVALWGLGLGLARTDRTKRLIVGAIAILPMTIGVDPLNLEPRDFLNPFVFSAILPLVVTVLWLAAIWHQERKDRAARDTELRTAR